MDEDYKELVEYLDKKFQNTATKQDVESLAMNFVSLEEFDGFKTEIKQEFVDLRQSINNLTNSIDQLVKAVSDLKIEYTTVKHQLSRHEKWIEQIAGKMGLQLDY